MLCKQHIWMSCITCLPVLQFSSVSIIPPKLHTDLHLNSTYIRRIKWTESDNLQTHLARMDIGGLDGTFYPITYRVVSEGEYMYAYCSTLSLTSVVMRWVVNATPCSIYPREWPGIRCTGGWVGPRAGLDGCIKSRPPHTRIRSPDRPARSESLYGLSYPGSQIVEYWTGKKSVVFKMVDIHPLSNISLPSPCQYNSINAPHSLIHLPLTLYIFHWHNPSGRTMALGLTQPLTEMSTTNISWGAKVAEKNPQHAFLRRGSKAVCPMSQICGM